MQVRSLEAFRVHTDLLAVWEARYGPQLLPVQELAVTEGKLLEGASVVVDAPTGAGKTLVGEMAALQAVMKGQRAIYLVPTKALAEAKFFHLRELYEPVGVRVLVTTRDRRGSDDAIKRGEFHIAVCVPEKLRSLIVAAPQALNGVGCVVADELQLLGDIKRGPCLEMLLIRMRACCSQLVGLSATLPNAEQVAAWLGARTVHCDKRPVELRKGVLCDGKFHYLEHNSGRQGIEEFPATAGAGTETLLRLVQHFCRAGEPTLIFTRDKRSSIRLAHMLAQSAGLPAAQQARERLAALPETTVRRQLWQLLASGVAFHNGDMQFAERRIVEAAFAAGEIGVLCATSTLALGVNLPARNVIVDPQRWWQDAAGTAAALGPLSRAEFENMGGRAGRVKFGDAFGRAIMLADSQLMRAAMWERYVLGSVPSLQPALSRQQPLQQLVTLCAAVNGNGKENIAAAYQESFAAFCTPKVGDAAGNQTRADDLPASMKQAIVEARRQGLVTVDDVSGAVVPTPLGRLCAASGVSVEGFCWLRDWAERFREHGPNDLEALVTVAMSHDAVSVNFPLSAREAQARDYCQALMQEAQARGQDSPLLGELLGCVHVPALQRIRAAKMTLVLLQWASRRRTQELEQDVRLPVARLESIAETVGWLLQTLAEIGQHVGWPQGACARTLRLAGRIAAGMPEAGAGLRPLRDRGLEREQLLALLQQGIEDPSQLDEERLARLATGDAPGLESPGSRQVAEPPCRGAQAAGHVLIIDHRSPDRVIFHGAEVSLRPSEYKLLVALAQHPGHCVPYEQIYRAIWDNGEIVQSSQVHWHRHNLSRKLAAATAAVDEPVDPIETVPRRGYRLRLSPSQVCIT